MKMIRVIVLVAVLICIASADVSDWRVIGGSKANVGQFPYHVSVRDFGRHHCGGSILNKNWVLTAAHCVYGSGARVLSVATGSTELYKGDSYLIKNYIIHEAFNTELMINDIALLEVNGEIKMSPTVQPIPLNKKYIGANATVTLSGWGLTSYPGATPNDLHFIDLLSITSEDCDRQTSPGPRIHDSQICTFTKKGEGACQGDSGGPLAYNGKIAGLVSWGRPCAVGRPDVFTRVSCFIDWIEARIN